MEYLTNEVEYLR